MADLSRLPQIDALLRDERTEALVATYGRRSVAEAIRSAVAAAREAALNGSTVADADDVLEEASAVLSASRAGQLARVINATGVILHTNLGRAPLSPVARAAVADASGYCTLEYELDDGGRGSRTTRVGRLAAELCGAEAATVVNNGAAAIVLVLATLATGREVVVSRGELIEIGGSFRLPDVMAASGATLREVGATNRTRSTDYLAACGPHTALIMKAHRSNFRVTGYTSEPGLAELAGVARRAGIPLVYDLGSGLVRTPVGLVQGILDDEPTVVTALEEGADLVVFSGDKLLGGPQAGFVVGRGDLVERCARHPLARALRIDKLQRAALEATLEAHLRADVPVDLPVWSMLTADLTELRTRAQAVAEAVGDPALVAETVSVPGGGSLPGTELDSVAVVLDVEHPSALLERLRTTDPPVIARIDDDRVVLDLRTVPPASDGVLSDALRTALGRDPVGGLA